VSKELLRQSPLFSGLNEEDLEWLHSSARRIALAPGDVIMTEGEAANAAYLVVEGSFEVIRKLGAREFVIDRRGAGDFMGESALLENARRAATVRAETHGEVLEVTRETFHELLRKCPDAALAVVQTVAGRLRHTELTLRQSEKMAALGTLSAGLAHELNNPAAAIQRSAAQLKDAMAVLQQCAAGLGNQGLAPPQVALIDHLRAQLPGRLSAPDKRSALERADIETELQEWLEGCGMTDAWEVAPGVAAAGWSADDLERLTGDFSASQRVALARSLSATINALTPLEAIMQSAQRITGIVTAVKSYAHLDRGPVQLIDVQEGLEDTLVILQHKIQSSVEIVRDYDPDVPRIEAYGSELNQVWTNVLDNAIEAIDGHGIIKLCTSAGMDAAGAPAVTVEITDNGPGIPGSVREHLFDAFFTTKEPGQGTGLGLHISYNIVVNQHRGAIEVDSRPGKTTFSVTLPLRISDSQAHDSPGQTQVA
jgi:signal transduction histidine kinase